MVVGYTMDTLYFSTLDSAMEVDPQALPAGIELQNRLVHDCSQNYTTGNTNSNILLCVISGIFSSIFI